MIGNFESGCATESRCVFVKLPIPNRVAVCGSVRDGIQHVRFDAFVFNAIVSDMLVFNMLVFNTEKN